MIIVPEKTYTNNPFVDNVIYYAKLFAMNCTVKDEQEALDNETKETLEDGDILIACVEGTVSYEMFKYIPKEILEKYIPVHSNLDLFVDNPKTLKAHLNHYNVHQRTALLKKLSKIAREVYIDHFAIMTNYINEIGPNWIEDNKNLYDICVNELATYKDLFEIMPTHTTKRIIKQYLNNYDASKIDSISKSLSEFDKYINTRTDIQIDAELANISRAMRNVFKSHYEMMIERRYVNNAHNKWFTYIDSMDAYKHCKAGTSSYRELYNLFPEDELINSLNSCINPNDVSKYQLSNGLNILENYLNNISNNTTLIKQNLTKNMQDKYLANYHSYMNFSIFGACNAGKIGYFDLIPHLPKETQKMILNTQIDEFTNLEAYEDNKLMLNEYLYSLPTDERNRIKDGIVKDMIEWYPNNHIEKNNYYRSLIGLPPMDANGSIYEDTLMHSWDNNTKSFKEFGDKFIKDLPKGIYPEIHWKQNIYEFDSYDIGILNQYGIIDSYLEACGATPSDPRYRYLRYLADNKLDLYRCRRASKFELIGIPIADDVDAQKRFVDCYVVNRDYVIRTVYSDAHKFQSDYYDKFMIIFILINTIMDMLSDITTMIIDREVFDARCIKWLFESFGVPYYSEIPIKYLRAMLKNLNTLLKYKSSTRNMIDICNLFGFTDVKVFGYYLFRERIVDANTGEYKFDENNDINYDFDKLWVKDNTGDMTDETIEDYSGIRYTKLTKYRYYNEFIADSSKDITCEDDSGNITIKTIINNDADVYIKDPVYNDFIPLKDTMYFKSVKADTSAAQLKFIKVPINEELTEYKNDPNYIIPYDEIVYNDEGNTWDGGRVHEDLEQELIDHEFNAVKTKYISVETITDLTEQAFQISYFYNMLFDNLYSEEALTVKIPYIKIGHEFKFMDVICYLFALMYYYNDLKDTIMYSPTQILYVKGYNFDEAINQIMNDPKAFTQEDNLADRENIFDINERIEEDNYNYREQFEGYKIKGFNLEADIDELDKWLQDYCQMSLDDFVIDDDLVNFDQIITLRQFFTLNNSYYQKDIFRDAVAPLPYNQNIKSAYGVLFYKKDIYTDMDNLNHQLITENGNIIEVINDTDGEIFVINYNEYLISPDGITHSLFNIYKKDSNDNYKLITPQYYYYDELNDNFVRLFDNTYYIVDSQGRYIFATNNFYEKDQNGNYIIITDDRYFVTDKNEPNRKCLVFGDYWIKDENNNWVIDLNKAYVLVTIGGVTKYVKWTEAEEHNNITVDADSCYIKHSDGHFIKFSETDYYQKYKDAQQNGENTDYIYNEEELYIEVDYATSESDIDVSGKKHYYKKVSVYLYENNWVYTNDLYIYDEFTDTYIAENDLLSPNNCYYMASEGVYDLVINNLASYKNYDSPKLIDYILVLDNNYDYTKYRKDKNDYVIEIDNDKRYIYNSDEDYIIALLTNETYDSTKSMIVVFNREITSSDANEFGSTKYNPEVTDKVWDENDWFYSDTASATPDVGMHGENMWYYRKPDSTIEPDEEYTTDPVGSGFYMESKAYIGSVKLEKEKKYYMAFDIETNFTGMIQIYNTADDSVATITDKVYEVTKREKQHISQVFTANDISTPEIRFLIYDFENYPIKPGDYIIISNIRFVRAYSDNFIAQDIPSYNKLQELYRTNDAIYKWLATAMANETDFYKYGILKKIYDSLMISKYNKEAFKISDGKYARTYTEFLENRDAVLYAKLARFQNLDPDTMHKEIADEIIEVTYAIDDCVDTYTYGFLYSYFPAVSANYIQQYITKIINWFKSWKVHLLGINTVYKLADRNENTIKILESDEYKNKYDHTKHNIYIHGTIKINPLDATNISGIKYANLYDLEDPTHKYNDYIRPKDRVRIISRNGNRIEYRDSESNMHLVFDNDEVIAKTSDGNNLKITSTNAGFETQYDNNLIITTDDNIGEQEFAHQFIDEINLLSGDYIDWRNLINE